MVEDQWRCVVGTQDLWAAAGSELTIRSAALTDAEPLYDCRRQAGAQKFLGHIVHSLAEMRDQLAQQRADEASIRCVIERNGTIVGDIGGTFRRPGSLVETPDVWDFHLGYCIHPEHSGQGVATAAVSLFVPLLHETFGVRRIVAMVFEQHRASVRVLEKQGFRLEGTQIAAVLGRDGHWWNDCMYAHLM